MRREAWRLIDSGPQPGALNMALDEALLEAAASGDAPPTLRVYGWRPPAVSLGRFQRTEDSVDLDACRKLGIDVVRRPTGGRAILHTDQEVTFSIVAPERRLGGRGVMECYRVLAAGIVAGLRRLGLDARLVERSAAGGPVAAVDPTCFAVKARCDLVVGTSKLVGSAQVHRDGVVLQQNSLPLRIPLGRWGEVFRRAGDQPAALGLWEAAGVEIPLAVVAGALRAGFEEAFEIDLVVSEPTSGESRRARELRRKAGMVEAKNPAARR